MIRLTVPSIDEDDIISVSNIIKSGFLVQGKNVAEFEKAIATYTGVNHAIAVSNCTAALHLALLALDVHAGDIVLVTTYSWVATANVIELCGAQPVFVDIELDTFNMDAGKLKEILEVLLANPESASHVKAILPVHTFGQMANISAICEIASIYGIPVIEDAACALGSKWDDRMSGTWGLMGCFSFHPRKAITTGEGGIITTNDDRIANKLRALRNHGQDPESPAPEFIIPGYNYRITEFQAAFGISQLQKLERIINVRRQLASQYNKLLSNTPVASPFTPTNSYHVYQSYVILLPAEIAPYRAEIIQKLKLKEIETNIGTWHIPLTKYYKNKYGYQPGSFPVSDVVFGSTLTLPLYEGLTFAEQNYVIEQLLKLL